MSPEYAFVTPAPLVRAGDTVFSPSITARARTLAPVFALNALGYAAAAYSLGEAAVLQEPLRAAKSVVLGDLAAAGTDGADEAERYRRLLAFISASQQLVLDLAAAPVPGSPVHEFYAAACPGALVAAGSSRAARAARELGCAQLRRVPEVCDAPALAPFAARTKRRSALVLWLAERARLPLELFRIRLLWAGERQDVEAITAAYPGLCELGHSVPFSLRCLAPAGAALEALADTLVESDPQAVQIALEPWTPAAMLRALAWCHLVVVPTTPSAGSPPASVLCAALRAGRLPVAQLSPYYDELAQYAWIGDDLAAGVAWALAHPREVLKRLGAAQAYVERVHGAEAVARLWLDVFQVRIK